MNINKIFKMFIGVIIFLVAITIPAILILLYIPDEIKASNTFFIYLGLVIFSAFGYIIVSIRSMSKELHEAVESMKMQNAAIAYKLTGEDKKGKKKDDKDEKEKIDISKVNLNPEEPLVPTKNNKGKDKKKTKKIDDNYDDFK